MDPTVKKIYRRIAKEYGLTESQIKEIVEHQFLFVKGIMREGVKDLPETFKGVQLTYLGKIAVRSYKLEEYKIKAQWRNKKKN
tara:strand:- start:140 stop:388 length:249 start_codon:yes stop_codon:yes gene_type:complete